MERCQAFWLVVQGTDGSYIQLKEMPTKSPFLREDYLMKETLKCKIRTNYRDHIYIIQMQKQRKLQFFKYTISGSKFKYLTGPHFSLGLHRVERGMEHVVENLGRYSPLFLFTCRAGKAHLYRQHVDSCKVLVNQTAMKRDFLMITMDPGSTHPLPEGSVYFLYSVTHAFFCRERRSAASTSSPASGYDFRHSNRSPAEETQDGAASGSDVGGDELDGQYPESHGASMAFWRSPRSPSNCASAQEEEGQGDVQRGGPSSSNPALAELRWQNAELRDKNMALRRSHDERDRRLIKRLRTINQETEKMEKILMN